MARASCPEPSGVWSLTVHGQCFRRLWSIRDPASLGHGLEAPCHVREILLASSGLRRTACDGVSEWRRSSARDPMTGSGIPSSASSCLPEADLARPVFSANLPSPLMVERFWEYLTLLVRSDSPRLVYILHLLGLNRRRNPVELHDVPVLKRMERQSPCAPVLWGHVPDLVTSSHPGPDLPPPPLVAFVPFVVLP